jgi:hypothetical protein
MLIFIDLPSSSIIGNVLGKIRWPQIIGRSSKMFLIVHLVGLDKKCIFADPNQIKDVVFCSQSQKLHR